MNVQASIALVVAYSVQGLCLLFPFAIIVIIIEFCFSKFPRRKFNAYLRTDFAYLWLSTLYRPFFEHFGALIGGAWLYDRGWAELSTSGLAEWSLFSQIAVLLILRDILVFIRHRFFHSRHLWPMHAVHHSPEEVNWLTAKRFHPLEMGTEAVLDLTLFAILGPSPEALILATSVLGFNGMFLHSNCGVTYGPLRYIFASPVYHRWHHSIDKAAIDKNFASMFSFLDLACGTFYMPADKSPVECGVKSDSSIPKTFAAQLVVPIFQSLRSIVRACLPSRPITASLHPREAAKSR